MWGKSKRLMNKYIRPVLDKEDVIRQISEIKKVFGVVV